MDADTTRSLDDRYVLHTYARYPLVLERGEGTRVYDAEGKGYLDFVGGIAVNALGHADPEVLRAIIEQATRLVHVSNLFHTGPQTRVAQMLVESSFADKVYFCNSGAEATEAAIKFARKWARMEGATNRTDVLTFSGAFHGRTMGALALTPREHYQDPFLPLMPGARLATFNDLGSAAAAMDDGVCAVILEPLQGEGGVYPADRAFMCGLRELCDRHGALLIFDEVQCGLGRTGYLWAHEYYGVVPDIMTLAKPLAGGLPMGATLVTDRVAGAIAPGDHGSTFAANPVASAAAEVVIGRIRDGAFLGRVREVGSYLGKRLCDLQEEHESITAVRGRGMIWGVQLRADVAPAIEACMQRGLLTLKAGNNVLRLIPPLTVSQDEVDEAIAILEEGIRVL